MNLAPGPAEPGHIPVMLNPVLDAIAPANGDVLIDGTFGGGGYARAFLDHADCRVLGIDRDPVAVARGRQLESEYPGRFDVVQGRYSEMEEAMRLHEIRTVNGVVFDLGLSSFQIDDPMRGFSFQGDGPLDMRMEGEGMTAAEFVNSADEHVIADTIWRYGEDRRSRAIARAIIAAREESPIESTRVLADIVARAVGGGAKGRIHPATHTFQALRIHINEELGPDGELARGLRAAERVLAPEGRLAVVSFHSLEDRTVKQFLTQRSGRSAGESRHLPPAAPPPAPTFRPLFRGVRKPEAGEISANPRARSARLRAAVRTTAPNWPVDAAP
jgi:16S rRNA (cytosine1402-N4)-methyltransferase